MQAYAFNSPSTFPYSLLIFFSNSLLLTGRFRNICSTETTVPFWLATTDLPFNFPEISKSRRVPFGPSVARAVTMWKFERAQREERASPRKPNVAREVRSE
jgi:hypothetical protein